MNNILMLQCTLLLIQVVLLGIGWYRKDNKFVYTAMALIVPIAILGAYGIIGGS